MSVTLDDRLLRPGTLLIVEEVAGAFLRCQALPECAF